MLLGPKVEPAYSVLEAVTALPIKLRKNRKRLTLLIKRRGRDCTHTRQQRTKW